MKDQKDFLYIPINRILALVLADIIAVVVSSFAALYIRFDFKVSAIEERFLLGWENTVIWNILLTLLIFWTCRLYKSVWKFASITEFINIILASTIVAGTQILLCIFTNQDMPKSYYLLYWALLMGSSCVIRFGYRFLRMINHKRYFEKEQDCANVLLIGAGAAGNAILKEIESSEELNLEVKCIIDDSPNYKGRYLRGVPIVGGRDELLKAVEKYHIDEIIFAIPSASTVIKKEFINMCKETGCKMRTLPGMYQLINGDISIAKLKDVEIEDLLGREPVQIELDEIMDYVSGRVVMVTGGGGSIGSELCRQIAGHNPKQLVIVDIYENNAYDIQQELKRNFPELNLVVLIASVRNTKRINSIMEQYKPTIVYHAAAHKHVPLMEDSPNEAIKNNVMGTYKTAQAAARNGVERFVLISTDKAVNPTNIMGASKRICEMIVQMMNQKSATNFVAVRFGNVLGSNGSVIPLFKQQIAAGGPVTVTDPNIIRYFMTIPEAVSLVLQAGAYAKGGEIFVLDMGEPVKIADLAENLIKLSGYKVGEDIEIKYTGLRPGEKMYEELLMSEEGLQKTANKLIYIGKPIEFDISVFEAQLKKLEEDSKNELVDRIREDVKGIVTTYQYKG